MVIEGERWLHPRAGREMPDGKRRSHSDAVGSLARARPRGDWPVIWLDALDLPIVRALEASYAVEGAPQTARNQPDASQSRYRRAGLVPYRSLEARRTRYPLLRYPWKEVREALSALAGVTPKGELVQLAYVNPETGRECMPVLGFSAIMLRPGETIAVPRRSASAVLHVIEGEGEAEVDGVTMGFSDSDTIAVPTHAQVLFANRRPNRPRICSRSMTRRCSASAASTRSSTEIGSLSGRSSTMIQARRIGHATFETPDLDRAIDYYTQVNGLVLAEREPERAFLAPRSVNSSFGLTRARARNAPGCRSKWRPNSDFAAMCRQLSQPGHSQRTEQQLDSGYRQSAEVQGPQRHDHRAVLGMELSRAASPGDRRWAVQARSRRLHRRRRRKDQ